MEPEDRDLLNWLKAEALTAISSIPSEAAGSGKSPYIGLPAAVMMAAFITIILF